MPPSAAPIPALTAPALPNAPERGAAAPADRHRSRPRSWLASLAALALIILGSGIAVPTTASGAETSVSDLESQLIAYTRQGDRTDQLRVLAELTAADPTAGATWSRLIEYWDWVEDDMPVSTEVPTDLPTGSTHAFVVLNYALNSDGTMQDELVGPLTTALAAAQAYPNARIVVTGGASKNGVTEGDAMHDWLVAHGVEDSRIIVENESATTVENANNALALLKANGVTSMSVITSTYHLQRGTLLFRAASWLPADDPTYGDLKILQGVGWDRGDGYTESVSLRAMSLAQLAGVSLPIGSLTESVPVSLTATGKVQCAAGKVQGLSVTATYSIDGFTRDVTDEVTLGGCVVGDGSTATVTLTDNGTTITATVTDTRPGKGKGRNG